MFSIFFEGIQHDFWLFLLAPIVCAIFRLIFIWIYGSKKSPVGEWKKWYHCFRYGFWWGMDWNAYIFLGLMILVSIPSAFFPTYNNVADTVRLVLMDVYLCVLYTAFMAKLIFYFHFHDVFNRTVWLGKNADKNNLADIFFNQNHGGWILLGYIPYVALCTFAGETLLSIPTVSLPEITLLSPWLQYGFNTLVFLGAVALFYWMRFGGTFRHRNKPEWDEVPAIVKNDIFMSKATMDDLVALEIVWKHPANAALEHSDEESAEIMKPVLPGGVNLLTLKEGDKIPNPLNLFLRKAKGNKITPPKHIFFLLGESHAQAPFDSIYDKLNLMEGSQKFRKDPHTVSINNFLSAGLISQPSLVSLFTGIYDSDMELNENKDFWYGRLESSLPVQLKKLGYRTEFWYGGGLTWGSLDHFAPAIGFDACHGGPDFCSKDAPKTWLGIYDHVFLDTAAELIKKNDDGPSFHFLYTTSNHGPYNMPFEEMGFDIERVMPEAPEALKKDDATRRKMGGVWYTDQALVHFIDTMKEAFPDSLFIVTGDHSVPLIPFEFDVVERREPSLRDRFLTSFAMYHPELTPEMLANNKIGGHMNIMPTIFELIAPEGFEYYSTARPLTEKLDHVVSPYCWMTEEKMGYYPDRIAQSLTVSSEELPLDLEVAEYEEERNGQVELTGWIVKHPELLEDAGMGKRV